MPDAEAPAGAGALSLDAPARGAWAAPVRDRPAGLLPPPGAPAGGLSILYLHQHFSGPQGSTATRSFLQAQALAQAGHRVTLACGRYAGARSGLDGPFRRGRRMGEVAGFRVAEYDIACGNALSLPRRAAAFLRFAAAVAPLALRGGWDAILASSTPLTVAIPALLARRLRGTPFVFEIRDPWPEMPRALGHLPAPVLAGLDALADAACRRAAAVVALTEGMAETALAHGADPARLRVLPQGADLALFGPHVAPWRPEGVPEGAMLAVYAGAHGPANGLDALLDAAALLRDAPLRLLLVGEGACKPALVARAAAEALPVDFLDPMPKPRLAGLLAGAGAVLHCLAPNPAFAAWSAPNKLSEGLAAGRPVVTNLPGPAARMIAEAGAGLATPAGDAAALAAALRALAADPARRAAMGRAGRALAVARLDARRIAREMVAVVEAAALRRWPAG